MTCDRRGGTAAILIFSNAPGWNDDKSWIEARNARWGYGMDMHMQGGLLSSAFSNGYYIYYIRLWFGLWPRCIGWVLVLLVDKLLSC